MALMAFGANESPTEHVVVGPVYLLMISLCQEAALPLWGFTSVVCLGDGSPEFKIL
jgi:hypothetical protein